MYHLAKYLCGEYLNLSRDKDRKIAKLEVSLSYVVKIFYQKKTILTKDIKLGILPYSNLLYQPINSLIDPEFGLRNREIRGYFIGELTLLHNILKRKASERNEGVSLCTANDSVAQVSIHL